MSFGVDELMNRAKVLVACKMVCSALLNFSKQVYVAGELTTA